MLQDGSCGRRYAQSQLQIHMLTFGTAPFPTGREVREEMFEEVSSLLHDLDDGMRPISVMFPYLPTAPHRKRDA